MKSAASKRGCHVLHLSDKGRRFILIIRKVRPSALLLHLMRRAQSWIGASIGLLASALFASAQAQVSPTALPTNGSVVSGQAVIGQAGARMDISQRSAKAILNWGSFNIGSEAQVNFAQPASTAIALNRVLSGDPSQIYGRLSANGQVFLLNPNGVVFGPSARVDVGGIVASTLAIKDSDFLAGNYRFTRDGASGAIINQGALTAAEGGYVALLAPEVRNQGVIQATLGTVALAAGDAVTLKFDPDAPVSVAVDPATVSTLIENKNLVRADGGTVFMSAKAADELAGAAIQAGGIVAADSLRSRNGQIVLDAGDKGTIEISGALSAQGNVATDSAGGTVTANAAIIHLSSAQVNVSGARQGGTAHLGASAQGPDALSSVSAVRVDAGSVIRANGGHGGQVELVAATGETDVLGTIEASGIGSDGRGGSIRVLGGQVAVYGNAGIDASGATAGGEILVGGDYQGANAAVQNARATYVGRDATLSANALSRGDGGRVIVWSKEATRVYGTLQAKGGLPGGNGGLIETSGGWLDVQPKSMDLTAPNGAGGTWYLDPYDITINNTSTTHVDSTDGPVFTSTGDNAVVSANVIGQLLGVGTNVRIATGGEGTQAGNITVNASILAPPPPSPPVILYSVADVQPAGSLTLSAHNNIVVNSDVKISSSAGPMNVTFISNSDGNGQGAIEMLGSSSITTNGGNIVFKGGGADGRAVGSVAGIYINSATLDAGFGTIDLRGSGAESGGDGVRVEKSTLHGDSIRIDGYAPATVSGQFGVVIRGDAQVTDDAQVEVDGRDIQISGQTKSPDPKFSNLKWWSALVSDGAVVKASSNGRILIEALDDGFAGAQLGAQVLAEGTSPITFAGKNVDLLTSYVGVGKDSKADYGGDITFAGHAVLLERRGLLAGPTIATSGRVIIKPLTSSDIDVSLRAPVFGANVRQILIGDPNTQNLSYSNANPIDSSLGAITVSSPVIIQASGKTTFQHNSGIESAAPGTAISLVTGVFENWADSSALSAPNGRWLIYANDPSTSFANLSNYSKHYNQAYSPGRTPAYAATGNWILYSVAPTLLVSPSSQTITYGDAPPTAFAPKYSGFIDNDTDATSGISGTATWALAGPVSAAGYLTAGTHDVSYVGGLASSLGYQIADSTTSTTELNVDRKPLTVIAHDADPKTYDGQPFSGGNGVTYSGFVAGETSAVLGGKLTYGGTSQGAVNAGNYSIIPSGLASANYDFTYLPGILLITPAPLRITANNDLVLYSGRPYSGGNGVSYSGFVPGDTPAVLHGAVTYGGSSQGAVNVGDYSIIPSGLTSQNYFITHLKGSLVIAPAPLTITANNDQVLYSGRPYSGGNGVTYAGFVNGENTQVLTGALVYGGTAQGAVKPGTYTISPSGLSAANYLVSFVDGTLSLEPPPSDSSITPRVEPRPVPPPVVSVVPSPGDGTVEAYPPSLPGEPFGESPVPGPEVASETTSGDSEGTGESGAGSEADSANSRRYAALAYAEAARHRTRTELYKEALDAIRKDPTIPDVPECVDGKAKDQQPAELCIPKLAKDDKATGDQSPGESKSGKSALAPEHKVALLFGNNAYKGKIRRLTTPVRDMSAVGEVLRSRMGYEVKVVENATKRDLIEELIALSKRVAKNDSVLVMYAGHGYEITETRQGYWLPVDASPRDAKSWVSNNDVYKLLKVIPAKQIILVSDSCFSGTLTKEQKLGVVGSKKDILGRRSVVAMSSGDETPVADVGLEKHSVFAYHLINQLDGMVSDEVASQLLKTMRGEIRKLYPQDPQIGGVISAGHVSGGDYLFLPREDQAQTVQ